MLLRTDVHSYISIGQNFLKHEQHHIGPELITYTSIDVPFYSYYSHLFPEFIKFDRIGSEQLSLDIQEILKQLDEIVSRDISDKRFQHIQYHV